MILLGNSLSLDSLCMIVKMILLTDHAILFQNLSADPNPYRNREANV